MSYTIHRILIAATLVFGVSACEKEDPLTTPKGGYEAFVDAMFSQNIELMWDAQCADTHTIFAEGFSSMRSMEQMIPQLQPSDREAAIQGTNVYLLERMSSPVDLFAYVLYWETLPLEQEYEEGMRIDDIEVEEDRAIVTTVTGQEFEMVHDSDGYWRVREPFLDVFAHALSAIQENRSNLEMAISLYGNQSEAHRELERLLGVTPSSDAPTPAADEPEEAEAPAPPAE